MIVFKKLLGILSSIGLSCTLLVFLFLLTLFGTFEQVDHGLFEVQRKYFESLWLVHDLGPIPLPLPGATLVMGILAVNLFLGGLVRIKWSLRTAGVIVVHIGIALMLAAGLVKLKWSEDGYVTLYEGRQSDEFVSYFLWEVAIFDASQQQDIDEFIIPGEQFTHLTGDRQATYRSDELPFDVQLSHFAKNCEVLPKGPMWSTPHPVIDGYAIRDQKSMQDAEQNIAGLVIRVEPDSGERQEGLLWGVERYPWTFQAGGKLWAASLRHKRFNMPFTVILDDFTRVLYPGTNTPKSFASDITKREADGEESKIHISMNDPLRDGGLVLFQSGWGPQNAPPGARLFSTFSVVRNPSDYWPLYSCIIIFLGLLMTFSWKLYHFSKRQDAKRHRDSLAELEVMHDEPVRERTALRA